MDKLEKIFSLQKELRVKIGKGKDRLEATDEQEIGKMTLDLLTAISQEISEARDCIHWKWWADREKLNKFINKEALMVELVDVLFFLLDSFAALGADPEMIFKLYERKWEVNMNRQKNNYSVLTKTEEDNHKIEEDIKKKNL